MVEECFNYSPCTADVPKATVNTINCAISIKEKQKNN